MNNKSVETDILIVGGGPAGLAMAIHFADLIRQHNEAVDSGKSTAAKLPFKVMLLEKANAVANHTLSGAVINPTSLKKLLPEIAEKDMPFETPVLKEDIQFFTKNKAF